MKNSGHNIYILGKFTLMFFFTIILALTSSMNITMNMQGGRKNIWFITLIGIFAAGAIFVLFLL